jgi:FKBP-type peptidyl-prolyl cis-trans isomerase FklB
MKINLLLVVFSVLVLASCSKFSGNSAAGSGSSDLAGAIDSVSYSLGADMALSITKLNINELNMAALVEGFDKVLNNDTANLKIKLDKARPIIMAYIQKIQDIKNEKNKKEGEAFLAANKKKEGVKLTQSGVQYIIIKEGHGAIPVDTSIVKVNYVGKLINDTVFDSSASHGQPLETPVKNVFKGWQDILKIMPVGSKWKVFIPQELAYGANVRQGGKIEPYMALVFEIELLDIVPPKAPVKPTDTKNQMIIPKKGSK